MSIIDPMKTNRIASPFLKWAGGKQGIAPRIVRFFPEAYDRYFEPFVGGGSVLFSVNPRRGVICDANEWLIDAYEGVRSAPDRVAAILDAMPNTKDDYLRIRSISPCGLTIVERAAHLIYLNKTCFRGLFRVNRHGEFNVPYGEYDRRYYDLENLRAVAEALECVEIRRGDFEPALREVTDRDFVYMDPPYYKLGGYSDFNRYTKDQFREADHSRLAGVCRELDRLGVRWALSNSDTPFVRDLFAGYRVQPIINRREINLNSADRDVCELLVMNFPPRQGAPESVQRSLFDEPRESGEESMGEESGP